MIITNVVEGLLSRFASGQISMDDVAADVERTIHRLADGAATRGPIGNLERSDLHRLGPRRSG